MVVQHNLTAMNSNRMLGITTASQAKSTEKLSSGYKINRAADDAAGLSISEKMRKQIRGLTQATANAQDGISSVQTAEGALTEVHDMLQRMNELAIKSSNGTMSASDRTSVQNEIDQLVTEIDRVSETTKFNETYLLKGDDNNNGNSRIYSTINSEVGTVGAFTIETKAGTQTINDGDTIAIGDVVIKSSNTSVVASVADKAGMAALIANDDDRLAALENLKSVTVSKWVSKTDATVDVVSNDGTKMTYSAADFTTKYGLEALDDGITTFEKQLVGSVAADHTPSTGVKDPTTVASSDISQFAYGSTATATATVAGNGKITMNFGDKKALVLDLQVGADTTAENKITVAIDSMSATSLGVNGLKVDGVDSTKADAAVNTIADAIKKVSDQRSALGAAQNRLEHTIANLDNIVENTTAAEAAIRDTDMATEMVKYSNNNILAQAGQSMLAQANQTNQGVLSLLG